MRLAENRKTRERFLGCTGFPECRFSEAYEPRLESLKQPPAGSGNYERELTRLIALAHPDKWQGHPAATELTKALLAARQRLRG
jgi:ssDNA-binding Zn-finger/Zn-ribbon topoisomerase 1